MYSKKHFKVKANTFYLYSINSSSVVDFSEHSKKNMAAFIRRRIIEI